MISIVLATKNGSKYISKAIESVQAQSRQDWELIIVDDGSTDNVVDIVRSYIATDSRIKLIQNPENLGLAKSLNVGLRAAQGEYIARLDDDDYWIDPNKLDAQVKFFESHPDHVLLATWYKDYDEAGNLLQPLEPPTDDKTLRRMLLARNPFGHSTVMMRRKPVMGLGGYDESLSKSYTEDWDLWIRLGLIGKFAILPIDTLHYLKRAGLSAQNTKKRQITHHIRIMRLYWRKYPLMSVLYGMFRLCAYIVFA